MPIGDEAVPSLAPSFAPASRKTSRVQTNVPSPAPHLGWHSRGYIPHWDHPGMIQAITFRLADSLPIHVLERMKAEILAGKDASDPIVNRDRQRQIENYLDAGHGACFLRHPQIADLVEDSLQYFDGERYRLLAWCIMPNHVHALIETKLRFPLSEVVQSWKSFTATAANRLLKRQGSFWFREFHDRYIRNAEHYISSIAYIEANPVKAGLVRIEAEWPHSSARYRTGTARALPARIEEA